MGFRFSCSLDLEPHINTICCKAYKVLELIKRLTYDFKLSMSLKILLSSLIRPILEYCAVIWDPLVSGNSHQMVQRKFLSFAGLRLYIRRPPLSPTCFVWKPLLDEDIRLRLNT